MADLDFDGKYPAFEFLPFETMIRVTQDEYYNALAQSDKAGKSNNFIEYMLNIINVSLGQLLDFNARTFSEKQRYECFKKYFLCYSQQGFEKGGRDGLVCEDRRRKQHTSIKTIEAETSIRRVRARRLC